MDPLPGIHRFGDYRLDLAGRELYAGEKLVQLSPLMFDCLAWLFERRDRAVGRDELSAAVWGRVDITDTQIDQLIRKVRRAVGDTGSDQDVIRTIPRFGYRWVAEVEPWQAPAPMVEAVPAATPTIMPDAPPATTAVAGAEIDAETPAVPAASARTRWTWRSAALALLLLAIGIGWVTQWLGRDGVPAAGNARVDTSLAGEASSSSMVQSLAVLPVVIEDQVDSESAWLRLGLMELISVRLREGGVTVVPTNNILALSRDSDTAPLDAAAVQAATGARIVVAPSLRHTSGGWRLQLQFLGADNVAQEVQTHADDAVASARAAADRLLVLLGKTPTLEDNTAFRGNAEIALYRIDAAIDGGDYDSARHLLEEAPADVRDSAALRLRRARVERVAGRQREARELFQQVLDSDAEIPLTAQMRTEALIGTGVLLAESGQIEVGRQRLDQAIELARQEHFTLLYADAMASRATLHAVEGHDAEADRDFGQARIALELAGDTLGLAELEGNHAATLTQRFRYAEASALLDRAIARMRRFPPGETLVVALGNRIYMHLAMLEPREALRTAEQASETVERVDNLWKGQGFLLHKARALAANGRLADLRSVLDGLAGSIDPLQTPHLQARLLGALAQLAYFDGRWQDAANFSARQLDVLSTPALSMPLFERSHGSAWLMRIRALQRAGSVAGAARELDRFSAWAKTQNPLTVAAQLRLAEAEQAALEHRADDAVAAFEAAMDAVKRNAAPADVVKVATAYGAYLIDRDDLEAATRVVGQVAQWAEQDFDCALLQVRLYHALRQTKAWQAALVAAKDLAGERVIPAALLQSPLIQPATIGTLAVMPER